MTESAFIRAHAERWTSFQRHLSTGKGLEAKAFPREYRRLCRDLTIARSLGYSSVLITDLNTLVVRGYQTLYHRYREGGLRAILHSFRVLPLQIGLNRSLFGLAHLVLYGAALLGLLVGLADPGNLDLILGSGVTESLEAMYNPLNAGDLRPEGVESDAMMFGFYIYNNVSIGFRTFALGLLAGLGSFIILGFNGAYLGLVAAWISTKGYGEPFWSFVVGHSAFELTGLLLFAMAGFAIGRAMIAPGRRTRTQAMGLAGKEVLPLIHGATLFLFVAAAIEAFWSAGPAAAPVKYAVGAGLWAVVYLYMAGGLFKHDRP